MYPIIPKIQKKAIKIINNNINSIQPASKIFHIVIINIFFKKRKDQNALPIIQSTICNILYFEYSIFVLVHYSICH